MVRVKVELVLSASPDVCYRQFCDPAVTRLWLPGLKKLKVVREEGGRPLEVQFSVGESLTYALVYAYDDAAKKVRWVTSSGGQDGVSGFATFAPDPKGCLFTYSIDSLRGRPELHAEDVAHAFAAFVLMAPR